MLPPDETADALFVLDRSFGFELWNRRGDARGPDRAFSLGCSYPSTGTIYFGGCCYRIDVTSSFGDSERAGRAAASFQRDAGACRRRSYVLSGGYEARRGGLLHQGGAEVPRSLVGSAKQEEGV